MSLATTGKEYTRKSILKAPQLHFIFYSQHFCSFNHVTIPDAKLALVGEFEDLNLIGWVARDVLSGSENSVRSISLGIISLT